MYGKLFAQMYDGTLATVGPWQALITFQQMIILADKNGVVDMTPEAISRRTTIPLDVIRLGVVALEMPDKASRSPDEDGRRIVRLSPSRDWGWRVVNYGKYRALRNEEERREYHREYWHERKKKTGELDKINARRLLSGAIASGRVTPGPCEVCGESYATEGHHPDYTKPLDVIWLCKKHHEEVKNTASLNNSTNTQQTQPIAVSSKQYAVIEASASMSGKPDALPRENANGKAKNDEAREVIAFLNKVTKRNYQPVEANLKLVRTRLGEASIQEIKKVIASKAEQWLPDPKMSEYLRPATLFNATKFAQYLGEIS